MALCTLATLLVVPLTAAAQGALSQSFKTDAGPLATASLVSLKAGSPGVVEAATSAQAAQLVGVIADKPLVELGDGSEQAQVVISGVTPVLISDINGAVHTGDKITASPIEGVGMKAVDSTEIVGTAQSDLTSVSTTTRTVTDKNGHQQQVHIGTIPAQINVSYYGGNQARLSSLVPSFLLSFGSAIAGKNVAPIRILIAFSCLIVGFLIAGVVLQAAVRSGIISIGRNPLAHSALRQSIVDVLVTCVGLLLITLIVFYLVLTL